MDTNKQTLKAMVRGTYDLQKLRIEMGNRIIGNFKSKLGQLPSQKEEDIDEDSQEILDDLRASYKKLMDGVKVFPKQSDFKGDNLISTYTELCLLDEYIELEKNEEKHFRRLGNVLKEFPVYVEFLEKVKGCGPAMSGIIISEIDIHKSEYPSSLWKYAGVDVAENGAGRSRREEHLVVKSYINKDGEEKSRKGITFNPFLKTKLLGVLASSFLRSASPYREIYDNYKLRLESHVKYGIANEENRKNEFKEKKQKYAPKGHRHNMAMRYMIKIFLIDLHMAWRKLEGLKVSEPYHVAKLGYESHKKAA